MWTEWPHNPNGHCCAAGSRVDFDLYGLLGVRLIGASAADVAAVSRQLGQTRKPLNRAPDITLRFVSEAEMPRSMRYLGAHDAGYTNNRFFVLRSRHKSVTRVAVPFEQLGGPCELICQSGLAAVPLLVPIINLTLLGRGVLALHASAFVYQGTGILTTGWSKGGKTEALLTFAAQGAQYIGDEWIYLDADGRMFGIPEPIRAWKWHLDSLPQLRRRLTRGQKRRLRVLGMAVGAARRFARGRAGQGGLRGLLARALPLVEKQLFADLPAEQLFPDAARAQGSALERVFFVGCHEEPGVTARPIEPHEIADRMVHSLAEEREPLMSYYRMFRFAFPERESALLEQASRLEHELLVRHLAERPCYEVVHPNPMDLADLYRAMRPLCSPSVTPTVEAREVAALAGG